MSYCPINTNNEIEVYLNITTMKTIKLSIIALIVACSFQAAKAQVSVGVGINIGNPAPVVYHTAPVVYARPVVYSRPVEYRRRVVYARPVYRRGYYVTPRHHRAHAPRPMHHRHW